MSHGSNGFAAESGRRIVATGVGVLLLVAATGCGTWDGGTIRTAGPVAAHAPGIVPKPGSLEGFSSPESVLFAGDRWFISNIGADREPTQDGDGYLTELNSVGTVTARHAMPRPGDPPLNAPKGLAYTDNRVFVADIDRVVGFDMDTHGQVFEARLGDNAPALLDDMALQDPRTLLITDTLRGAVDRLDLDAGTFEPVATGIPGATGITLDRTGQVAYVVGEGVSFTGGDLWRIDLTQHPAIPQRVGAVHGVLDGISVLPNGNLVVSDWASGQGDQPGRVTIYRPDGIEVTVVNLPESLHGPADFAVDPAGRNLWIPAMRDNRVVIVPLP
ncbi:MAG: hypothetical protein JWN03_5880 [Nocardia sp.]|uniref:SMP-30/gluconolactonase/LRE family protein n=1 Tax=Nocardia sp. TaxID=1821 RepID=UPI002623F9A2|nr:hypothetical protein [Nocardia sp.]MCU1645605.1 hypothetical protein [Nocardia sp.]